MRYYYLDGDILSTKEGISPFDLAIHRSFAVFDYCIFRDKVIIYIEDYIQRFRNSIRAMDLELEMTNEALLDAVHTLIQKNDVVEGGIKFIFTGGASVNAYDLDKASLLIFILPIPTYPDVYFESGMKLISLAYVRDFPMVKSTNYFVSLAFRKKLEEHGAQDFVYHMNDIVSESSRSNLFLVKDGVIKTPRHNILEGVTRKHTIRISNGIAPLKITDLSLNDFYNADEVFLTSTTKGIMPIAQMDHITYHTKARDSITKILMEKRMQEEKAYISLRRKVIR